MPGRVRHWRTEIVRIFGTFENLQQYLEEVFLTICIHNVDPRQTRSLVRCSRTRRRLLPLQLATGADDDVALGDENFLLAHLETLSSRAPHMVMCGTSAES